MIDEVHTFFVCNMLLKAFNVVNVEKKFEQGQNPKSEWCRRLLKGTGHFFETLSVASVPGTDHS